MPSVIYEDTLADSGESVMGGTRVYYVAWEITTLGPSVRHPQPWDVNGIVGAGYWQLGNDLSALGLISAEGWDAQHWLYSEIGQWIASPGQVGSDFSSSIAQYIRWTLTPGTIVHLYVFGDV